MKALLGLTCGFVLTLAVFGSGLAFAVWLITASPPRQAPATVSMAELWTKTARPVDKAAQNLERLPAEQLAPANIEPKRQVGETDPTATGAIAPATAELPQPHIAWCASRYRSYRPQDNSYMSYSGQQRPCISPYLDADRAAPSAAEASYVEENGTGRGAYAAAGDDDHVASCFSRYRSYRPEDNSYQPYSGGPRRQCQ
ncbi:BA14K family protein [Mesorhizobium sp. B292B1B]|uniref:BA14K family protein n=1 Tax=unclassified Mesorhizobium TaxID=325217 RepID=UPI00112AFBAA|nr:MULTISPECIES: BA14K family protein [unclassified Mesorhizobium]MCA0016465.1 BA14K family protein [Mesorhizobium sp. B294B1A1]MCA0040076.1 BA14K family protein [Mesorhizobium sp. B292B1B]TPM43321.1 BA14K family protein [Mesorhizobium sp. B2-3-2]